MLVWLRYPGPSRGRTCSQSLGPCLSVRAAEAALSLRGPRGLRPNRLLFAAVPKWTYNQGH